MSISTPSVAQKKTKKAAERWEGEERAGLTAHSVVFKTRAVACQLAARASARLRQLRHWQLCTAGWMSKHAPIPAATQRGVVPSHGAQPCRGMRLGCQASTHEQHNNK